MAPTRALVASNKRARVLFLDHFQFALLDFVFREDTKIIRKTEPAHGTDEPLGGVVVEPPNSVAKIVGKL